LRKDTASERNPQPFNALLDRWVAVEEIAGIRTAKGCQPHEEPHAATGVKASPSGEAGADSIGFEFLIPTIGG
jgi:hypothetical protein